MFINGRSVLFAAFFAAARIELSTATRSIITATDTI
jgi:hypothetical protein